MRYSVTIWVGCAFCGAVPRFAYGLEHHPVIRQSIVQEECEGGITKRPRNHKVFLGKGRGEVLPVAQGEGRGFAIGKLQYYYNKLPVSLSLSRHAPKISV